MRRLWAGCVAAVALLAAGAAEAADIQKEFAAALKPLKENRCEVGKLRRLIDRPQFSELTGAQRSLVWSTMAFCDPKAQHEAVMKAIAEPDALALAFSIRFADAVSRDEYDAALVALEDVAKRKADETAAWFSDDYVYDLGRETKGDPAKFRRFMAALEGADWKPQTPHYGGDWLWARYAGLLVAAGERSEAWRAVGRIRDPGELARMSLDKRFDEMVNLDPRRFDIVAAAERELERGRALLAESPRDGSALSKVVRGLRYLGRHQEALATIDPVIASREPILHAEGRDHRNWALNDRALVLVELGRYDDAVAGMRAAASLKEDGGPNVSQTINLAGIQNAAGQPAGALATLAPMDAKGEQTMSPYGLMWVRGERACAHAALGQTDAAKADVAFTAEHASDNWNARSKALLCLGDLDTLAAAYKTRLANEEARPDALLELSRFRPLPNVSAFDTALGKKMEAIRARPDIQAAVAAVGRTRDFPIHAASLIDSY